MGKSKKFAKVQRPKDRSTLKSSAEGQEKSFFGVPKLKRSEKIKRRNAEENKLSDDELYNTDPEDENDDEGDDGMGHDEEEEDFEDDFADVDFSSSNSKNPTKKSAAKRVRFNDANDDDDQSSANEFEDEEEDPQPSSSNRPGQNPNLEPLGAEDKRRKAEYLASLSGWQRDQHKIRDQIAELEAENLSEKPWQLRGEILSGERPQNSLLEEYLLTDVGVKPKVIITKEISERIEDIIKQRIKDKAFDDVVRREPPEFKQSRYSTTLALDQQKSKVPLAQLYEQEYTKQLETALAKQTTVSIFPTAGGAVRKYEKPEHEEIAKLMKDLFHKLDALTNFRYNPRPPIPDHPIASKNLPSIAVEEVAPIFVSEATLLAPEEVAPRQKAKALTQEETSATKKIKRKKSAKKFGERQAKLAAKRGGVVAPGSGPGGTGKVRVGKPAAAADPSAKSATAAFSSSTKFFESLQLQVQKDIDRKSDKEKGIKPKKNAKSSAAFKL